MFAKVVITSYKLRVTRCKLHDTYMFAKVVQLLEKAAVCLHAYIFYKRVVSYTLTHAAHRRCRPSQLV